MKIVKSVLGLVAVVTLVGVAFQANAIITVNSDTFQAALTESDNTLASIGDLVRIGTFDTSGGFDFTANATNLSALESRFSEFGTGLVGANLGFDGVWSFSSPASEGSFPTKKIYLWTFNAATVGAASQHGIFSSSGADWIFPDPNGNPPSLSTTIELAQVNQILVGDQGLGTVHVTQDVDLPFFKMAVIPEPATGLLVAIGLMGALALRRR